MLALSLSRALTRTCIHILPLTHASLFESGTQDSNLCVLLHGPIETSIDRTRRSVLATIHQVHSCSFTHALSFIRNVMCLHGPHPCPNVSDSRNTTFEHGARSAGQLLVNHVRYRDCRKHTLTASLTHSLEYRYLCTGPGCGSYYSPL